LGIVTFLPFLTAPNPDAPAITTPIAPTTVATPGPTFSPSQSSSQSPSQSPTAPITSFGASQPEFNELEIAIFATLIVIVALLSVIIALLLKRRPQKTGLLTQAIVPKLQALVPSCKL
jgi:hypothetical protein